MINDTGLVEIELISTNLHQAESESEYECNTQNTQSITSQRVPAESMIYIVYVISFREVCWSCPMLYIYIYICYIYYSKYGPDVREVYGIIIVTDVDRSRSKVETNKSTSVTFISIFHEHLWQAVSVFIRIFNNIDNWFIDTDYMHTVIVECKLLWNCELVLIIFRCCSSALFTTFLTYVTIWKQSTKINMSVLTIN